MPNQNNNIRPKVAGQLIFGSFSQNEILSNPVDKTVFSGQFLTFSALPGDFTSITEAGQTSVRIIGMVIYQSSCVSSSTISEGRSEYKAGHLTPYVKQANLILLRVNQNVTRGQQVYIDISNADPAKRGNLTNVSTNNLLLPTAVFEQDALAGNLVPISFNLPN